ncbi:M3 family metallopeptidase [Acetobacter orleanensis]|uniref:Dipeptidyl carboxypeptidase n=1 Tax=Acetobacter orleanensis TaxID=104099 RepID=A0A4Y3TP97_9PROT|nr:M3 family metallopeptidase [Acetobacter orleanensis]KXV65888.1 dipeptidyl carboxypeptidase [Acetobacter orleanensis]PCD79788.1 dipeptidyl carboxypeptidase II [Acetobacter orleanensis]GAN69098.1 peptidyl-dipeptidase Dcp [Acetobacter orleanensis JCM 7639]GBR28543.1 peptidyl-dipeptidase DCP [Acetobacter orleanensis NRIC 0473]GEB83618.1 dipeptidyl carboxypeptidase II [Acetobacter orleanensis]
MTHRSWLYTLTAATCLAGWSTVATAASLPSPLAASNPFATESTLPFHAPRFDLIKDTDYQPALEQGMAEQASEMEQIANTSAPATFENTITAMERSGRLLDRTLETFNGVYSANTNPVLDKVQEVVGPKLSAHEDSIYLNPKLFARVKDLHAHKETLGLNAEQKQVLDVYYQNFVQAGAQLSDADKAKLRDLNTRLSKLETVFQQKLLAGTKASALIISDKAKLAGLDNGAITAALTAAKDRKLENKWLLPLQNTTQQPAMESLTDRETRQALFEQSWTRVEKGGDNDTRDTIATIAQLRAQKAALFGYKNYAAYVLADQMAKTPEAVHNFIAQIVPALDAEQKREAADIQNTITKNGASFQLKPWDWPYYAAQVRKARLNFDENQVKPYFELKTVLQDGVFFAANRLYGITFKQRTDIPTYNPDVMVFEVYDKDGSELGLIYFDYFQRDNKNGGAWMSNFVGQSTLLGTKPVVYNVANFTKPAKGEPALISFDDVTTMFHEFGHALHGLFASQTYPIISGTSVARDFVEFPSQFNEHWALNPTVLAHYARHYKTGAAMPENLVALLKKAATFNQGYRLGEVVSAAELDMDWHSLGADAPKQDVDTFEKSALSKMGLETDLVPPRYRSSYFLHIWSNGYSAGYYAYLWTEMLDDDTFAWFEKNGGLTRKNGERFRSMILSRGHTQDYGPMFRAFYGKDPDIGPMLTFRGLNSSKN